MAGEWDVFLCYKSEDFIAAKAVRDGLESRGLRVFLDVIEGEIWAPLSRSIEQELARSRTLVALITKNFPVSPHCREELHVALSAAYQLDAGETSRVMAVVQGVSPDDVRPAQLTAYRLPYSNVPSGELVDLIARNVTAHVGLFGDATFPASPDWYPFEMSKDLFGGRYAELWEIHSGLRTRERNAHRGPPVFTVSGRGGQGKTALCLEYARLFARDHRGGVFVLDLGGSDDRSERGSRSVEARFREHLDLIARQLNLRDATDIRTALAGLDDSYLWILDDVPSTMDPDLLERMYAPTRAGRTLITTRARFERFSPRGRELDQLGPQVSADVVTSYRPAPRAGQKAVREIVRLLDEHPLGLRLAAGLTTAPDFADYPALLADLSSNEPDRLEDHRLLTELPAGCTRPFSRILLRSFDSLNDAGREVLCAASVLAPTVIPRDLLTGMVRRSGSTDKLNVDDGIAQGVARGLLTTNGIGCTMHALVARAIRVQVTPSSRRASLRDAALVELTEAVERTRQSYQHGEVLHHLPHVRAVVGLLLGGDEWVVGQTERHLLNETGRTRIEAGQTGEALALYKAMYEACEAAEVDWYTRCVALVGLATAHELEGEYSTALELKEQAVRRLTAELGADDPDTLIAVNNLAVAHMKADRYEEAHILLRSVYRRQRRHSKLGRTHRDTLITLNNLAIARGHLGKSAEERHRHQRVAHRYWVAAWERWRRIASSDDHHHLVALNGLALSYRVLGLRDKALELSMELHKRRAALLGPDHPDTLGALENKLILQEEIRERAQ